MPHLVTALSGPLFELERRLIESTPKIERWLRLEWQEHTPPFYGSVDLRNAGYKIAPLDANLFTGVIARLALLGAAIELESSDPDQARSDQG